MRANLAFPRACPTSIQVAFAAFAVLKTREPVILAALQCQLFFAAVKIVAVGSVDAVARILNEGTIVLLIDELSTFFKSTQLLFPPDHVVNHLIFKP